METTIDALHHGVLTRQDFTPPAVERRREGRTNVFRPIRVFSLQSGERLGHLTDCSPHGVGILLRAALREGEQFMLKLQLERVRMVVYRVCYCRPDGDGWQRIGGMLTAVAQSEGHELEEVFRALLQAAAG